MSPGLHTAWVIDDEPFARRLIEHQLLHVGFGNTRGFGDAEAALRELEETDATPALLCCDLQMPGLDGLAVMRLLAQRGCRIPLVLISGEDDRLLFAAQRLARGHGLDVLAALPKPMDPSRLREALKPLLAHSATENRPQARDTGLMDLADEAHEFSFDELRRLIDERRFVAHYQPKVSLREGALVGVECLVRLQHPERGLLFPNRFVPRMEALDLIDALTDQMIDLAAGQARRWLDAGWQVPVAVNVSMNTLHRLHFPDEVQAVLQRHRLPHSMLMLEVTESQAMRRPMVALEVLSRLGLKRIQLAIDDFGTGHSSLTQLRDVPFAELKIDRGFVQEASTQPARAKLFDACVQLARELSMRTVAEGVETERDWHFVRRRGCAEAQGWFIGRAMPGEALATWHRSWLARVPAYLTRPAEVSAANPDGGPVSAAPPTAAGRA